MCTLYDCEANVIREICVNLHCIIAQNNQSWTQDCKYNGFLLVLLFDIIFVVRGGLGVNSAQEHGVIGMLLKSVL